MLFVGGFGKHGRGKDKGMGGVSGFGMYACWGLLNCIGACGL